MAPNPPTLLTLPEELLLLILSHITDQQTLYALSTTSPHLHRLTSPQLYHTFPGRHSELFLRTISHSPHLALHTRRAVWQSERKSLSPIDVLEKSHIVTRLNQLSVPHGIDLASLYASQGRSAEYWFFEILLLFLPGVEEVAVKESWLWDDHRYWFTSLSPFFNPLSSTCLVRARLDGPMRIENVVPLLTVPSLRVLDVSQVTVMRREGYRVFQWSVWPVEKVVPRRSSGVEVLRLRESWVDLEVLRPVMEGIRGLREFSYEHVFNDLVDGVVGRSVDRRQLAECLSVQRASLECVRVRDAEKVRWDDLPSLVHTTNMSELRGDEGRPSFERLRTLDVGPLDSRSVGPDEGFNTRLKQLLDVLPSSLETIRFSVPEVCESLDSFLRTFAVALAAAERKLKSVEIVDWDPTLGWYPGGFPMLQKMYIELGLRLSSVARDVFDVYGAEPLLIDEETEPDWVFVTDLRLASLA